MVAAMRLVVMAMCLIQQLAAPDACRSQTLRSNTASWYALHTQHVRCMPNFLISGLVVMYRPECAVQLTISMVS